MSEKVLIIFAMLIVVSFLGFQLYPAGSDDFYESFDCSDGVPDRGVEPGVVEGAGALFRAGAFASGTARSKDGMLCLSTGSGQQTGGGEWRRPVDIVIDADTALVWKWAAYDAGEYQLWLKLKFSNDRAIYYLARDSKPPGRYDGKQFNAYQGETFRDRDGRLRFFPSVYILVDRPTAAWTECQRTLAADYRQTYGELPVHLGIREIIVGMWDDSTVKVNELGIDYIKIVN